MAGSTLIKVELREATDRVYINSGRPMAGSTLIQVVLRRPMAGSSLNLDKTNKTSECFLVPLQYTYICLYFASLF